MNNEILFVDSYGCFKHAEFTTLCRFYRDGNFYTAGIQSCDHGFMFCFLHPNEHSDTCIKYKGKLYKGKDLEKLVDIVKYEKTIDALNELP